ncbi:DUF4349 domain-containing protein [Alkalicoccus urumqiensis]|uniref:DUF4349 domain-containing protein n=1 Tax=Alkalicoccus urumqiensis TaxID=1548213 RepID=A0A2P6MM18_ALKUR|nr:DUF4349 domain-containing protein [Alkalicoccus urumqiensis]PRO67290.1 hypothetical protein C6I21_01655 [Alkalicoccus urumqiensis]
MRRKGLFFISLVLAVLLLGACMDQSNTAENNTADMNAADDAAVNEAEQEDTEAGGWAEEESEAPAAAEDSGSQPPVTETESFGQQVIYTAEMSIIVEDYDQVEQNLRDEVASRQGYVVDSTMQQEGEEERQSGSMTVRVPRESFEDMLTAAEAGAVEVESLSTRGNDVSEEYVDLEARLRSQEIVEERLLSFMEDADSTDSLLQISSDLSDVRNEIERVQGRMNYLDDQIAYSTITIAIREERVHVEPLQDQASLNTWERAESMFMSTVNSILQAGASLFVFVVGASPVLIPLLLLAAVSFWWFRRRRMAPRTEG